MKWNDLKNDYRDRILLLRKQGPREILQVSKHATNEEVKAAYRRLVKIYHPDKSHEFVQSSNTEMLKIINEAYATLINKTESNT